MQNSQCENNTILRKKNAVLTNHTENKLKWYNDKTYKKFFSMLFLNGIFFLAELIGGLLFNSLTLLSDSYHMLSDILALIIGVYAFSLSKKSSKYSSFGMDRASVMGGLINSTFLLAMCLTITIEAIHRLIEILSNINNLNGKHNFTILDSNIDNLIIISSLGLFVNIIGLCLFHEHSHTSHTHNSTNQSSTNHSNREHNLNIQGVTLHILGDFFGSVAAVSSSLIIKFVDSPFKILCDPIFSLTIVCIIVTATIPVLKECINILMENIPKNIKVDEIKNKILEVENVKNIHDLHIWCLTNNKIFATIHLSIDENTNNNDITNLYDKVKIILHNHNIHSSSIQAEFYIENKDKENYETNNINYDKNLAQCNDIVCESPNCLEKQCC